MSPGPSSHTSSPAQGVPILQMGSPEQQLRASGRTQLGVLMEPVVLALRLLARMGPQPGPRAQQDLLGWTGADSTQGSQQLCPHPPGPLINTLQQSTQELLSSGLPG